MIQTGAFVTMAFMVGGTIGAVFGTSRAALAQTAPATEVARLGDSVITLHLHDFLTPEELTTLRLVASNDQALSLFVPNRKGYAAIAVSPNEGFIRDGAPVASAKALAELPDAAGAKSAALEACNAARSAKADCVIVLEVAPAP
jgi:hypothetical protein